MRIASSTGGGSAVRRRAPPTRSMPGGLAQVGIVFSLLAAPHHNPNMEFIPDQSTIAGKATLEVKDLAKG